MNRPDEGAERIVVAVDGSPQSLAALDAAATLAGFIGAELCGLFVEDQELQELSALPFSTEIGAYSATVRPLTTRCIPRQFRARQATIEAKVKRAARRVKVHYSFRIGTGSVADELLAAAKTATIFSLGRMGHFPTKRLGAVARKVLREARNPVLLPGWHNEQEGGWQRVHSEPLIASSLFPTSAPSSSPSVYTVVYTGTEVADRALEVAAQLAERGDGRLRVLIRNGGKARPKGLSRSMSPQPDALLRKAVAALLARYSLTPPRIQEVQPLVLLQIVQSTNAGLLVFPVDYTEENDTLLDGTFAPILLVP